MARYMCDYAITGDMNTVCGMIGQFLESEGYGYTEYHGENVFKKGKGLAAGPTFVKMVPNGNILHLEAWVKFAVMPGVYAGEMDLEGVTGIAVKKPLKERMMCIASAIHGNGLGYMIGQYSAEPGQPLPTQQPAAPVQPTAPVQPAALVQPAAPVQPTAPVRSAVPLFCTACGAKLLAGAAFCSSCGNKIG